MKKVVIGEAKKLWPRLLDDFAAGRLQQRSQSATRPKTSNVFPDRSNFRRKRCMNPVLIESARGCPMQRDFGSISAFFDRTFSARPVAEVV